MNDYPPPPKDKCIWLVKIDLKKVIPLIRRLFSKSKPTKRSTP